MACTNTNIKIENDDQHNNSKKRRVVVKEEPQELDGVPLVTGEGSSAVNGNQGMTRSAVLRRRAGMMRQLAGIYRDHYWSLIEEVKKRHRDFVWNFGTTPDYSTGGGVAADGDDHDEHHDHHDVGGNRVVIPGVGFSNVTKGECNMHGCKSKAMALTRFCHAHILSDPNQVLYTGCTFAINRYSPLGPAYCMKPVVKSARPALCSIHCKEVEEHLNNAFKKEGLGRPIKIRESKINYNVLVAEFVRCIQTKRKGN